MQVQQHEPCLDQLVSWPVDCCDAAYCCRDDLRSVGGGPPQRHHYASVEARTTAERTGTVARAIVAPEDRCAIDSEKRNLSTRRIHQVGTTALTIPPSRGTQLRKSDGATPSRPFSQGNVANGALHSQCRGREFDPPPLHHFLFIYIKYLRRSCSAHWQPDTAPLPSEDTL
jgi:hypothetical protein